MNPSFKNNNYNKDSNLLINSYDKKFSSTFIPTSTKLNINDEEYPIYSNHKTNKTIENKSFDSLKEFSNSNGYENYDYDNEVKIQDYASASFDADYFSNYKYYQPQLSLKKKVYPSDDINYKINSLGLQKEYTKYNQINNNQRKNNNPTKENNHKIIDNIFNNNFIPKRSINTINNHRNNNEDFLNEGMPKTNSISDNNSSLLNYDSDFLSKNNNNNFISILAQRNYNEDSFSNEGTNEENNNTQLINSNDLNLKNNNINNMQMNKLTRYDIRKKKWLTEGITFFIKKARNKKNYQFLESKSINLKQSKNINKTEKINKNEDKDKEPNDNKSESIYFNQDNDEIINNHNFVEIKVPSNILNKNKKNLSKNKKKVNNYQYKEIKVKGPINSKPVMKLRIGINGEKFYEKYIPEKKVIKYTYEPVCEFINNENVNNIGFKKIVSHYHLGVRKKYKKINPKNIPNSKIIVCNDNFSLNSASYNIKENNNNNYKYNKNINKK